MEQCPAPSCGTGIETARAARWSVAAIAAAMRKRPTSAKLWFCWQTRPASPVDSGLAPADRQGHRVERPSLTPGARLDWKGSVHARRSAFGDTEAGKMFVIIGDLVKVSESLRALHAESTRP